MNTLACAKKWFKQAKYDLQPAKDNNEIHHYAFAVFLSQQAIEKLLKALFLLEKKESPPRTHSNEKLARLLSLPDDIFRLIGDKTAPDYETTRYPDAILAVPYEEYTLEIAQDRVKKAVQIFESLKDRYYPLEHD